MNRKLIALAVGAALAAPAAIADVQVGGKMRLSYGSVETKSGGVTTEDSWQMNDQSSRLRVKGSEDLGSGLKANFFLEYSTKPDCGGVFKGTGADGQQGCGSGLGRRNQWVGLSGDNWGELRFGRHDTPLKFSQGKFDVFNDQAGDIAFVTNGELRVDNVLAYVSPNFSGFGFAVAAIPGEGFEANNVANSSKDGAADFFSLAGTYGNGPIFLSAAYDTFDPDAVAGNTIDDRFRLIGTYAFGAAQVGGMYEANSFSQPGIDEENIWGISGKYSFGNNAVKAMYLSKDREFTGGGSDDEKDQISVGVDHNFSKRTSVWAEYTDVTEEFGVGGPDDEYTFFGVGIGHNF